MINLERTFDLLVHLNENPDTDYVLDKKKGIVLNRKQQAMVLHKAIQSFMQSVGQQTPEGKIIQAFTGSSDLPILTKDVFNVTQTVPEFDTLWQASFRGVPSRSMASGRTIKLIRYGFPVAARTAASPVGEDPE